MPQFKKYKLNTLCTKIGSGSTPRGGDAVYKSEGISLIRSQNILDFTFSTNGLAFIDEKQAKELSNVALKERDVLLNITGDSVARVSQVPDNILPARVNQHVAIIRANQQKLNPEYLKYSLLSRPNKEMLLSLASTGATRKAITKAMIEEFEIEIPDEEGTTTQTLIAYILSSLDDKIELNRRTNKTLEQIAQTLFKKYFVDDIDPENLPEGWRVGKLGDICTYNQKTLSKNDKLEWINYIEISEVSKGYIGNIARYKRGSEPSRARRILKHGDTVLSTVRPDRGSYFLAVNPSNELLVSTGFAVFTSTEAPYTFTYLFLTQEESINYYGFMAHGAAYPAINPEIILKMEIAIPPKSIFEEFHNKVEPLLLKFHSNNEESKYLCQLRDSVLPKLMSGEIEVNITEKELAEI